MKKLIGIALAVSMFTLPALRAARADELDDMAGKMVGILEKLADTMVADKADCSKMAKDVDKIVDDNQAFMKEVSAKRASLTQAQKDSFKTKYGARVEAATKKMMDGGTACQNSEDLKKSMQRFAGAAGH
jgi:hypothetical protein